MISINCVRKSDPKFVTDALKITSSSPNKPNLVSPSLKLWNKLCRTAGGVPHSPMRSVEYRFYLWGVPSYVATHFVRHHVGVQPYVKSQRDDINNSLKGEWVGDELYINYSPKISRSEKSQGTPVNMILDINVNSLLDMAKARLCGKADKTTRAWMVAMKTILNNGDNYDKIVAKWMKPPCEWYGKCFEFKTCRKNYE